MMNLVDDGLVIRYESSGTIGSGSVSFPVAVRYLLTEKGRAFVDRWLTSRAARLVVTSPVGKAAL
jgi:hypothetical protein